MSKIAILGSTGSIGTQALEIAREYPEFKITALSANSNVKELENQIREFKPDVACMCDEECAKELKIKVSDTPTRIIGGADNLSEISTHKNADTVLMAVVGISGLAPTIEAIKSKKKIALANKETLVTGGHIVTKLAKENDVPLLPVDSEHSAIFQSLQGCHDRKEVKKILLTCSGGPFYGKSKEELKNVTLDQALKHPNWDMGAKITIDSSTLVNKGLEVIEAKWLFNVDIDDIEVLVHRQSIVHSMVEYTDNGIIAQLGAPDMRLPIQYAFTYPKRMSMRGNELSFKEFNTLTFSEPDTAAFPALRFAYDAGRSGGILPTVFNSADEAAVELFLNRKIQYYQISELIGYALSCVKNIKNPSLEDIYNADKLSREIVFNKAKEV